MEPINQASEFTQEVSQSTETEAGQYDGDHRKPQFNAKSNGKYVGSAWLSDGKYGKYISLSLREGVQGGNKVFLSPRKGSEGILG